MSRTKIRFLASVALGIVAFLLLFLPFGGSLYDWRAEPPKKERGKRSGAIVLNEKSLNGKGGIGSREEIFFKDDALRSKKTEEEKNQESGISGVVENEKGVPVQGAEIFVKAIDGEDLDSWGAENGFPFLDWFAWNFWNDLVRKERKASNRRESGKTKGGLGPYVSNKGGIFFVPYSHIRNLIKEYGGSERSKKTGWKDGLCLIILCIPPREYGFPSPIVKSLWKNGENFGGRKVRFCLKQEGKLKIHLGRGDHKGKILWVVSKWERRSHLFPIGSEDSLERFEMLEMAQSSFLNLDCSLKPLPVLQGTPASPACFVNVRGLGWGEFDVYLGRKVCGTSSYEPAWDVSKIFLRVGRKHRTVSIDQYLKKISSYSFQFRDARGIFIGPRQVGDAFLEESKSGDLDVEIGTGGVEADFCLWGLGGKSSCQVPIETLSLFPGIGRIRISGLPEGDYSLRGGMFDTQDIKSVERKIIKMFKIFPGKTTRILLDGHFKRNMVGREILKINIGSFPRPGEDFLLSGILVFPFSKSFSWVFMHGKNGSSVQIYPKYKNWRFFGYAFTPEYFVGPVVASSSSPRWVEKPPGFQKYGRIQIAASKKFDKTFFLDVNLQLLSPFSQSFSFNENDRFFLERIKDYLWRVFCYFLTFFPKDGRFHVSGLVGGKWRIKLTPYGPPWSEEKSSIKEFFILSGGKKEIKYP